jgi:hypothetical protein
MAVTIPQLVYWLAYTMDDKTAAAFRQSGSISDNDAASVEKTIGSPIVGPLLQALRASTSPGGSLWDPMCQLPTLKALAVTQPPAGGV